MKKVIKAEQFVLFSFLFIWLIFNLIQSYFTELHYDEAYYWMYSRYLDWGYFDHPPMVALLIKLGYSLFQNTLGVRLLFTLLGAGTLYIVYQLVPAAKRQIRIYIILLLSTVLTHLHVAGFLALPDLPLVFFTALFFLVYQRYTHKKSILNAVLLAVVIAGLLYSKYHGVLVVFFTFLSNWKLYKEKTFWLIVVLSVVFMLPHAFWQYTNDFPTFKYHLMERSSGFGTKYVLHYLSSFIGITGPFAGLFSIYFAFKNKRKRPIDNALYFTFVGFIVFFFLMSFKGRVEAHWMAAAFVPLFVLSLNEIADNQIVKRILTYQFIPIIILIFVLRIFLMHDFLPQLKVKSPFHGWRQWAGELQKEADGRKVEFLHSYKYASLYAFYTKEYASCNGSTNYRKSQFELWDLEQYIQGEKVCLFTEKFEANLLDTFRTSNGKKIQAIKIDNFRSYNYVKISILDPVVAGKAGKLLMLSVSFENTSALKLSFTENHDYLPHLSCRFYQDGKFLEKITLTDFEFQELNGYEKLVRMINLPLPKQAGEYKIELGIKTAYLPLERNSYRKKLFVSK